MITGARSSSGSEVDDHFIGKFATDGRSTINHASANDSILLKLTFDRL